MAEKIEIEIVPSATMTSINAFTKVFDEAMGKVKAQGLIGAIAGGLASNRGASEATATRAGQVAGAAGGMAASAGMAIATGGVSAVMGGLDIIQKFADMISEAVNAFDPSVMEMFNLAIKDALAVVGRALVPVFQILTPLVQMVGDYLATVMDEMGPVIQEMVDSLKPLLDVMKSVLIAILPALIAFEKLIWGGIIIALKVLVESIMFVADNMMKIVGYMLGVIHAVLDKLDYVMVGLIPNDLLKGIKETADSLKKGVQKDQEFKKSSRGASSQGARTGIGIADLNKDLIMKALSTGGDPNEKTAANTGKIANDIITLTAQVSTILVEMTKSKGPAMAQP